ncbi:MAG: enoyl-CoA hydratase/isomerase family protein [Synergistaceae bacterium]|jgi:enoyl-CoA hydratase|nr:enoyl-CoA hydratase/isomerase family protein [Synergistaceae bacterium]
MYVKYEQRGYVGIITIDRQKSLNAMNSDVLTELGEVLDGIDPGAVRCVIVTGTGKSFVAGADIGEMVFLKEPECRNLAKKGNDVFSKLEKLAVPTIAAVNGFALGGGCELAMACDIRVACESASFGQPETTIGIIPGFGGTQRLPRIVGMSAAMELLFTGRVIDAEEALRIGLVNHVYPREELMNEAIGLAERIASSAPIAVRAAKAAVSKGMDQPIGDGIAIETDEFAGCFGSKDQINAMTAFIEKREPEPFIDG